jgi:hypothetical protein
MPNYHSLTDKELQLIFDQVISYLNNKKLIEPDWKEIAYLFEYNKYNEIMDGMICAMINIENLANEEFNDDFFSEYLEEGEKINNSKRVNFVRERIAICYREYSRHTFSLHATEIKNKENQKACLGFTVSGPGGQYGFDIDCIGVFSNTQDLMKSFDKSYFTTEENISNAQILRLWKR